VALPRLNSEQPAVSSGLAESGTGGLRSCHQSAIKTQKRAFGGCVVPRGRVKALCPSSGLLDTVATGADELVAEENEEVEKKTTTTAREEGERGRRKAGGSTLRLT